MLAVFRQAEVSAWAAKYKSSPVGNRAPPPYSLRHMARTLFGRNVYRHTTDGDGRTKNSMFALSRVMDQSITCSDERIRIFRNDDRSRG
jgi:hypothetical protein